MHMWGRKKEAASGIWLNETARKVMLGIGVVYAIFAVALVIGLVVGDTDAPWVSQGEDPDKLLWLIPALIIACLLGGFLHGVKDGRGGAAMGTRPHVPAFLLGYQWLLTGWRLWLTGPVLACSMILTIASMFIPEAREFSEVPLGSMGTGLLLNGLAWMTWAVTLKGRELRRGKERIRIADEYLEIREMRLNQEYNAMTEKFLLEQQEWRDGKVAELYEQILDQQARGVLPCPNCHGHRKSA
jgi:hypothetical protein